MSMRVYEDSFPEQISPDLLDQIALFNESATDDERLSVGYEAEYLTLYAGRVGTREIEIITQGESEVNDRVRQINRENGNLW